MKTSTIVFIIAVFISLAIWFYMFQVDMQLISDGNSPRFARSYMVQTPDVFAHIGLGWSAQPQPFGLVEHDWYLCSDCPIYVVIPMPTVIIAIAIGIYLLVLFLVIKSLERVFKNILDK